MPPVRRDRSAPASVPTTFPTPQGAFAAARASGRGVSGVPSQRQPGARAQREAADVVPLASILHLNNRVVPGVEVCASCGGSRISDLRMTLTDGTYVAFVTCERCPHTRWVALNGAEAGTRLDLADILVRAAVHKRERVSA